MSVDHLTDAQIRALVVHCTDAARKSDYFAAADLSRAETLNKGSLSHWLKGTRNTPALFAGARRFCNAFFGDERPLPAPFAAPAPPEALEEAPAAAEPPQAPEAAAAPEVAEEADDDGKCDGTGALRLCSWNLKNFGKSTSAGRRSNIVLFMHQFDIVAVQEVRLASLREALHTTQYPSMRDFRAVNSAMYGTDSRRESQGFYFKPATVRLLSAETPPDVEMVYKPYVGRFQCRASNKVFTLVNAHIKLGAPADVEPRRAEAAALAALVARLGAAEENGTVYVCGDYNLETSDVGFHALRRANYVASNWREPTTVGAPGRVYDAFWYPAACLAVQPQLSRVATFEGSLHANDTESRAAFRREVSDHLPCTIDLRH